MSTPKKSDPNWRDPALKLALAWWWLTRPRTVGVRGIVADADGRILFVRHSYGNRRWFLPGGGGHGHETAAATLRREIREETGLEVLPTRLVGAYLDLDAYKRDHIFVFACERVGGELRVRGGEIAEAGWFWLPALPEPLTPGTRTVLRTWQAGGCGYGYWPEDPAE
jgi:ADP-ribose pyrophosphatase YjhB (NUDIX family)